MVLSAQQGQCGLLGMDSHSDGAGQKHLNVRPLIDSPHPIFGNMWSEQQPASGYLKASFTHVSALKPLTMPIKPSFVELLRGEGEGGAGCATAQSLTI